MKIFLICIAVILWVFGGIYLIAPANLATQAGLSANAAGFTDIRATYGGFQLGFGLFLFHCALSEQRQQFGVLALAIILGAVGLCRGYGILVDGQFSGFHQIGLVFEVTVTLISLYLLFNSK
ncbi:MAG: DUF4345 family protein [Gammaproteobacteria bacterium]